MTVVGVLLPGVDPVSTDPLGDSRSSRCTSSRSASASFLEPRWRSDASAPRRWPSDPTRRSSPRPPRGDGAPRDAARDRSAERLRASGRFRSKAVRALYEYRDFAHFIEVFMPTSAALEREDDFRQIAVEYAGGGRPARRRLSGSDLRAWPLARPPTATSSSAASATAPRRRGDRYGIEIRLTPDIARVYSLDEALQVVRATRSRYRDRGVVGVGLGDRRPSDPPEPYAPAST